MRSFLAIELSSEVKRALAGLVEELSRARLRSVRLVRPEGIHLTLKFLGDIDESLVGPIVDGVSAVAQAHGPLDLEVTGVGVFPSRNAARVLWAGVRGDLAPLLALQRDIEQTLAPLGFPPENRGFTPHLTLGRLGGRASAADRRSAAEALSSVRASLGVSMRVTAVSLMRSQLLREGPVYDRLASLPLHGGS